MLPVVLGIVLAISLIANLLLAGSLRQANRRADRLTQRPATPIASGEPSPAGGGGELAAVREIQDQTATVRELAFTRDLEPEFLSDEELARDLQTAIPDEDLEAGLPDEEVLKALGMLPSGDDLVDTLRAAAEANVLGYYDPETERLVVRSGQEALTPLGKITLSHELTHAVTDQHYDLERVLTGEEPDDVAIGTLALIEGDATLEMNLWAQQYLSVEEQVQLGLEAATGLLSGEGQLPPGLEALQSFPYLDGMAFVQYLYEQNGWEAVNDAYGDPPSTSEQVLHPEKYLSGETGERVTVEAPIPGSTRFDRGEVGELFLRTLLDVSGVGNAALAADGWDGGAYEALRGPDGVIVAFALRWDTSADDDAFEDALAGASIGGCVDLAPGGPTDTRFTVYPGTCRA